MEELRIHSDEFCFLMSVKVLGSQKLQKDFARGGEVSNSKPHVVQGSAAGSSRMGPWPYRWGV